MLYRNYKLEKSIEENKNLILVIAEFPKDYQKINFPKVLDPNWLSEKRKDTITRSNIIKMIKDIDR